MFQHFGKIYHALTQTNNLLVTVNSSVNFIIYCIFGDKFKRMLSKLLCSMIGREDAIKHDDLVRHQSHYPNGQFQGSCTQVRRGSHRQDLGLRSDCHTGITSPFLLAAQLEMNKEKGGKLGCLELPYQSENCNMRKLQYYTKESLFNL